MRYELKTKNGYDFYAVASALQKSIRRDDYKIAGFFALELFPDYSQYLWKRLITISAEDCFGIITKEVMALYEAFNVINNGLSKEKMKGRVFISKAVILLCTCKHSRDSDIMGCYVYDKKLGIKEEELMKYLNDVEENGEAPEVPEYAYDVHTLKGKKSGKTKEDFFKKEENDMANKQKSLFNLTELNL